MIKLESLIFFLLIFFLPTQFGKHFWPSYTNVSGIRVDYLSPTLYFTDILIILLFILFIVNLIRQGWKKKKKTQNTTLLFAFFLVIIVSSFSAKSPAVFYGIVKLIEFGFLAFYIKLRFSKKHIENFIDVLSLSSIIISSIAIFQFFLQRSIGGLFYFLGERTFNSSTIGIANMIIDGREILRPYSIFPHPNVLAFFLFFVIIFASFKFLREKKLGEKLFLGFTLFLSTFTLLLTFSRIIIFLLLLFYFIIFIKTVKNRMYQQLAFVPVLIIISYALFFHSRFFELTLISRDFAFRGKLTEIAFSIFRENPYFGVGINNFFIHEISYQKTFSPILLQPVHNIYLLTLSQIGIFGFIIFLIFIIKSIKNLLKKITDTKKETKDFYVSVLTLLGSLLFVGMFDHFFLTVQQGQLLFSLIIGFSFFSEKSRN